MQYQLNENSIKESIDLIEKLDYSTISIKEIEDILTPLFKGYRITAPSYHPGVYLYRMRVSKKPEYLEQISYPNKPEYIKEYGRANDIGQPLFYGSIGKNVPFFETNAEIGDKIVLSLWKTNEKLLLNHIGFTKEVNELLKSNRQLDAIYPFVNDTKSFSDLNTFVYNYLALSFSKRINQKENQLYKLTIAIANKLLMGDLIQGILYPTIAMAGNSDNVVIKTSFVDKYLKFVSVEYLEVIEIEGTEYKLKVLDSATKITNGKIEWSGKMLGWSMKSGEGATFSSTGNEWLSTTAIGERFNPAPIIDIPNVPTILEQKYIDAFPNAMKVSHNNLFSSPSENVIVKCSLVLDFNEKSRHPIFYIPECSNPAGIIKSILLQLDNFLWVDKDQEIQCKDEKTEEVLSTNKDLTFSNKIYIYSEINFTMPITESQDIVVHAIFG